MLFNKKFILFWLHNEFVCIPKAKSLQGFSEKKKKTTKTAKKNGKQTHKNLDKTTATIVHSHSQQKIPRKRKCYENQQADL